MDSLINEHLLAYVTGPRFVNPIFYSLANFVLSVCMGVASMKREAPASVFFQKNGSRILHFFTLELRLDANRKYKFPCIIDTKFPKLTGC